MARVLVTHNYHLALDPHAIAEGKPYPPLGTAVIAAALRRAGHDVVFHDATFVEDPTTFAAVVAAARPDRVAIIADPHAVPQKMCLAAQRRAAFDMVAAARSHGAAVLVTGPDVSDRPADYLRAGADAVIRGEPDASVLAWADGADPASLPGGMTDADAPVPSPAPPLGDLAGLPPPAWDLCALEPYARAWKRRHGVWEAPVSAARGCPYRCNWCAKPIWGRTLVMRPPEDVVAEARALAAAGADRVWFTDDIFALKRGWLAAFRDAAVRAGGIPPYRCLSRADLLVRDGFVDDLAATGCVEVWMGAESGSQAVLDAMDKDQDVGEIATATRRLRARGIRVGFFLQLGYPGERFDDVRATIGMVRSLVPDEIGISVSYPLPGTPFYERVRDRMKATNWETAMDCVLLFDGDYPQPFYTAAREVIRREHAVLQGLSAAGRLARLRRGPNGYRRDLRRAAASAVHAPRLPWLHLALRWHARSAAAR